MSLSPAITAAVTALRELARLADVAAQSSHSDCRRAKGLRELAHRCAGQIQLHEDRT